MTSSKPIDKDPPQQISQPHIPLTKPLLPPLTALIPLLEEIWRNGWVTNNGPLQRRLEATLTSQLGWKNVVSTANGTLALQLACRALGLEGGGHYSLIYIPRHSTGITLEQLDPSVWRH